VIFDTAQVRNIHRLGTEARADLDRDHCRRLGRVILRYNSAINDPAREVLRRSSAASYGGNKMALVGLPLYYMRLADAQAMITSFADLVWSAALIR